MSLCGSTGELVMFFLRKLDDQQYCTWNKNTVVYNIQVTGSNAAKSNIRALLLQYNQVQTVH